MLLVPLQPVPYQTLQITLVGQNCQLSLYVTAHGVYFDLIVNGVPVSVANLCRNIVLLNPIAYSGFIGNFFFIDTQGNEDPLWEGLGTRFMLIYLTAAELAFYALPGPQPTTPDVLTDDVFAIIFTSEGDIIEVITT
jgi:hypothetical protein